MPYGIAQLQRVFGGSCFLPVQVDQADLWAIYKRLLFARGTGLRYIEVESDNLSVVAQLNSCDARTINVALVRSTFMLMQRKWRVKITLAYREANLLADFMAKSAVDDRGTRMCYDEPPQGAGVLLLADAQG
ncbi:hypothetical protein PVK06_003555 [Gossypium arboreum]|uniref:RNase H type-1 domain-containing protein n=1 Tax=Gossypium arboreum TaxID=29729 RepID=A0ABR0R6X9_GOSAR|nr:hypothetical protein PVK06_003555 [Gossypium arboreum]